METRAKWHFGCEAKISLRVRRSCSERLPSIRTKKMGELHLRKGASEAFNALPKSDVNSFNSPLPARPCLVNRPMTTFKVEVSKSRTLLWCAKSTTFLAPSECMYTQRDATVFPTCLRLFAQCVAELKTLVEKQMQRRIPRVSPPHTTSSKNLSASHCTAGSTFKMPHRSAVVFGGSRSKDAKHL